jgi:hypothetical protein
VETQSLRKFSRSRSPPLGEEGLGVKLDAPGWMFDVTQRLHLPVAVLLPGPRHRDESLGKGLRIGDERVIASHDEGRGQPFEEPGPVVVQGAGLPVHGALGSDRPTPVGLAEALVTQTHPQHRHVGPQGAEDLDADPGLIRRARPRRDHDVPRCHSPDLPDVAGVVPDDPGIGAQGTEHLDQVEGEGVVVVDDEEHVSRGSGGGGATGYGGAAVPIPFGTRALAPPCQ